MPRLAGGEKSQAECSDPTEEGLDEERPANLYGGLAFDEFNNISHHFRPRSLAVDPLTLTLTSPFIAEWDKLDERVQTERMDWRFKKRNRPSWRR